MREKRKKEKYFFLDATSRDCFNFQTQKKQVTEIVAPFCYQLLTTFTEEKNSLKQ